MGCRVLCRSLHLGCPVDFCELYLHTCMERGHAKGLHVRKQHRDKREQCRCELRSALHVLRFLFRWEALIGCMVLCSSLHWDFRICFPVGSNLYYFGRLLDAFWTPFGCLLDAFWIPGRLSNFNQFQDPKSTPDLLFWEPHFDTILAFLLPCWRSVFCCFFGCVIFWHFAILGSIRGPIWNAFWGAWEPWESSQNVEGSVISTLWKSFL